MALEEIGARLRLHGRREFSADAKAAERSVERLGRESAQAGAKAKLATRGFAGLGVSMGALRNGARTAAVGIGVLSGAIGIASVKVLRLATDALETESKFRTVFAGISGPVDEFIKTTNQRFGIPTKDLQDAAATFGVFGRAAGVPLPALAGFSTSLVQASLDLGSFYNMATDGADGTFAAIRSGLAGETEPLRKFGIFLSEAKLKTEAATLGLTGALSDQQKVMIRQRLILSGMGVATGDVARTAGSAANQWRAFKGRLTEGATVIGRALLPKATELLVWANKGFGPAMKRLPALIDRVGFVLRTKVAPALGRMGNTLREEVLPVARDFFTVLRQDVIPVAVTVAKIIGGAVVVAFKATAGALRFFANYAGLLGPLLAGLVAGFVALKVIATVSKAFAVLNAVMALNPIGLVVIAIAALAGGLVYAYKQSETFRDVVNGVFKVVLSVVRTVVDKILGYFEWILRGAATAFGWVPGLGGKLREAAQHLERFRDDVNAALGGINDKEIKIRFEPGQYATALKGTLPTAAAGGFTGSGASGSFGTKATGLATGGTVTRSGMAIYGERGPELGWVPRGLTMLPVAQTEALSAAVRSSTVAPSAAVTAPSSSPVVNEHHVYLDGREITANVVTHLRRDVARR